MSDPLLCCPDEKPQLEARNSVSQLDYITHVVTVIGARDVRESHILELQSLAVQDIFPCGGQYRHAAMKTVLGGAHPLPEPAKVALLVRDCLDRLARDRANGVSVVERAALALWRLNWIHPFAGGNGRMVRAIVYMMFCMDCEFMIPGIPTMPVYLANHRDQYLAALRAADEAEERGTENVGPCAVLLARAFEAQILSVVIPHALQCFVAFATQ